jgi:hypothetical protein
MFEEGFATVPVVELRDSYRSFLTQFGYERFTCRSGGCQAVIRTKRDGSRFGYITGITHGVACVEKRHMGRVSSETLVELPSPAIQENPPAPSEDEPQKIPVRRIIL